MTEKRRKKRNDMTPERATEYISGLRFRPGWRFLTLILSGRDIFVSAEVDTYDTRYRDHQGRLYSAGTISPTGLGCIIDVSAMDEAALCHALITKVVRAVDDHEDREMLVQRDGRGGWTAPLHPHTHEGEMAWRKHAAR